MLFNHNYAKMFIEISGEDNMSLIDEMKTMKCTSTDEVIRDYIFDNAADVLEMTTRELSNEIFTSPTAISRYCKKLGIDGFPQFKLLLSTELHLFQSDIFIEDILPLKKNDTAFQIISKMKNIQIQAIEETEKFLDYNQLQDLVHTLMKADNIDFYGIGINYYISEEIRYLLTRIGKKVTIRDNKNEKIAQVLSSKKGNVAFVLSHTGEEKEQIELARILKKKGTIIVTLTGYTNSTLAKLSNFHFYIKPGRRFVDMGPIIFSTSTRYVLYTIFGYLFTFCYENQKEEFELYAKLANYETQF